MPPNKDKMLLRRILKILRGRGKKYAEKYFPLNINFLDFGYDVLLYINAKKHSLKTIAICFRLTYILA